MLFIGQNHRKCVVLGSKDLRVGSRRGDVVMKYTSTGKWETLTKLYVVLDGPRWTVSSGGPCGFQPLVPEHEHWRL